MASDDVVLFERRGQDDRVGLVTLNRPDVLNAVDARVAARLGEILEEADADPQLRALVLTGSGRAFSAGADLARMVDTARPDRPPPPGWGFAGIARHFVSTPIIAAVNGLAYGGGLEIVLACDLAVAAESATFALPEVTRGILAGGGGLVRLPAQIPPKIALRMAYTGEPITAAEAARWGLVNAAVPAEKVLDEAFDLAERVCANAPLAVQASKRVAHRVVDAEVTDEDLAWRVNNAESAALRRTNDAREGPLAFTEQRAPRWTGT